MMRHLTRARAEAEYGPLELENGYWYPAEALLRMRAADAGMDEMEYELEQQLEEVMAE